MANQDLLVFPYVVDFTRINDAPQTAGPHPHQFVFQRHGFIALPPIAPNLGVIIEEESSDSDVEFLNFLPTVTAANLQLFDGAHAPAIPMAEWVAQFVEGSSVGTAETLASEEASSEASSAASLVDFIADDSEEIECESSSESESEWVESESECSSVSTVIIRNVRQRRE